MFTFDKKSWLMEITKGDTGHITVAAQINGADYTLASDDKVILTVKENIEDTTAVITAESTGSAEVTIEPAMTKSLKSGQYVYDVQIVTAAGDVYTISPLKSPKFKIYDEVG